MKAEQQALFVPTESGEQPAERVQVRLLHRTDDPETSKVAARKVYKNRHGETSLSEFLYLLDSYGDMTCKEAARKMDDPSFWAFEFNRRVKAWAVAGHIELTGEVRDGGRVWRIAETAR